MLNLETARVKRKNRAEKLRLELARIINKLDKTYIRKIILFGSLVHDKIGLTSDIDIIIIKDTHQRFLDRLDCVYKEIEPNMAVDILVYTPQEFKDMSAENSFIRRVIKEGNVLYDA